MHGPFAVVVRCPFFRFGAGVSREISLESVFLLAGRAAVLLAAQVLVFAWVSLGIADDSLFEARIAPLLAQRCLECHDGNSREGGLDLSRQEGITASGPSLIVPGDAAASAIWQRVAADEMPPEHALSADEKAVLQTWINHGAEWKGGPIDPFNYSSGSRAGYDWWSLQPLANEIPLPPVGPSGSHPIDRFIDQKLQQVGLSAAGPADLRTQVRRLFDDLIGLPPSYADVTRYAADPSNQAWESLVDRLLDSPEFGERWAQHWLDVARFGESDGFEYNQPRDHAWHYRDWVIQAFNQDLPYDRFAQMQLAGDSLENATTESLAAQGFLVSGIHNPVVGQSPAMKANARHSELEEIAATVSQAFLGLTIHCARCHDHKYDPISTADYYRFIAALDGIQHGNRNSQPTDDVAAARIEEQRLQLRHSLHEAQIQRGAIHSLSGNAIVSREAYAVNQAQQKYLLRVVVSPTVWANAAQATRSLDGVLVRLLRADGSVAAHFVARPGGWIEANQQPNFIPFEFEYIGDGSGDLRVRMESMTHEDRFGGAVDCLSIAESQGQVILEESFDDLTSREQRGVQADTSATVYFGLRSDRWEHSGINAIHAVEVVPGNDAVQLYGGASDVSVEPIADSERQLQRELDELPHPKSGLPVFTVVPGTPGVMHVMRRGNPMQPVDPVAPSAPRGIRGLDPEWHLSPDASDADRRLALARWLTDPNNGPFHRTAVNRVWHWIFNRGLVATPSDLGFQGGQPSHAELLEWLASDFRASGLSIKKLIRQIVLSETYRRSSVAEPELQARGTAIDRDAVWLWRRQPERLDAEVLRDSMLAISGALSRERFGPGYRDVSIETVGAAHYYRADERAGPEFDRRTIYRWRPRGDRSSLLEAFDCPDPAAATPERAVTTTPTQAFSLWNHAFVLRLSRQLADRIQHDVGTDPAAQVRAAWQQVLCRDPNSEERLAGVELVSEHGLPSLCRVLFNAGETVTID
ncbi:MAG: PSD1 and planctomycete cytochrome C domain-containing protein [Pirellulaceae bacterium]|nr:PSD1 and planctomycete cytochrome C domain-containing protein [Pirellulaceae bacterium]